MSMNKAPFSENLAELMNSATAPYVTLQRMEFLAKYLIGANLGSSSSLSRGGQVYEAGLQQQPQPRSTCPESGSCSVSNSILMTKPRQQSSNNSSQVEDHPKPLINNMTAQYGINGKEEVIRGGYNVQVKKATSMTRLKTLIAKCRVCSGSRLYHLYGAGPSVCEHREPSTPMTKSNHTIRNTSCCSSYYHIDPSQTKEAQR
ncbi:hypothetical protein DPMN_080881 [Dreissena polymorpha]|uniref:Uncharacterized protein n=1 Tax=Dreissena polymorpha TaxID=45954 RepID=A0A9D3Y7M5_DREPO|nr:hypothetical protein DPMN_080881 [Dreissena polymorpha]